jgi:uncharacterized protein (TIGR02996 family)
MPRRPNMPKGTPGPYPRGWEPFLAAINADLDDDTPRLVFADWLQENGDEPRAEFIRLQCAAARGEAGAAAADALLAEHRPRWLLGMPKGLRDRPSWCVFRRGFITAMIILGRHWASTGIQKDWDADGKAIRRITALEELHIEQPWNTLVESRTLTGIRVLTLPSAGSGLIESLAKSPVLPSLTDLAIVAKSSDGLSQRSFRALFANPKLARLRRLRVQSIRLGNLVAEGLAAPHFAGLEELRLPHDSLDEIGMESLVQSPALASLRVLDFLNNQIGDAGLAQLLRSPDLRNVEELVLHTCQLTAESVRALAKWEGLRTVRRLDLRGNLMKRSDVKAIRDSKHARNLAELPEE